MTKHKHYQTAYRAYQSISFSPEKSAINECEYFDDVIKELKDIGADEKALIKFESLFLNSLNAKSNCMSVMVVGPSNFPVAKMEKMNNRERARTEEMFNFVEKVKLAIHKKNNPSTDIRSDDKDAITKLKEKLANLEKNQEKMKACNKIIRDKKDNKIERLLEILGSKEAAEKLLEPNYYDTSGFPTFKLSNNNTNIRSVKLRIKELEEKEDIKTSETRKDDLKLTIVQNAEDDRIQFFFDHKPAEEVITIMKSRGFKWSRNNNCWQRLWNKNCEYAVKNYILPKLKDLLED